MGIDIVGIIAGLFFPDIGGKTSAFDKVAANIYTMPLPDLSSPDFKAQYAVMWALGIIISIVVGFLAATFALGKSFTSIGNPVSIGSRMMFFTQVTVVGFLATPALYIIVYMADVLSDASRVMRPNETNDTSWLGTIVSMFNPDSGLDFVVKEGSVWVINHQLSVIQQMIPVMVMCTSAAFAFSVLGKAGKSIWHAWWAIILTVIFAKPALAWLFSVCAWGISHSPNKNDTSFSLLALTVAAAMPFLLLLLFYKKSNPPIHPMVLTGPPSSVSSSSREGGGFGKFIAPLAGAVGWVAADHAMKSERTLGKPEEVTHRTPGSRRVAAAKFGGTKAAALASAHPVTAAALGIGSVMLNRSGNRSAVKSTKGSVNTPPTTPVRTPPTSIATPRPVVQHVPQASAPVSPPRAPHEMPTSTPRQSLGRKKS